MKPYCIAGQWIDLDHVLGVDDAVSYGPAYAYACVRMAFRDRDEIFFGALTDNGVKPPANHRGTTKAEAEVEWEAFKVAWKTKDTMFCPVRP